MNQGAHTIRGDTMRQKNTGRSVCFIGLGANIGDPQQQLCAAVASLAAQPGLQLQGCSSVYVSAPMGPAQQPEFLNAVCELRCDLQPLALLDLLQALEDAAGRVRSQHWGPRVLDLDLLLYDDLCMDSPRLQLPHPGLGQRSFVLYPLLELCGETFKLPDGSTLASCMTRPPGPAIRRLGPLAGSLVDEQPSLAGLKAHGRTAASPRAADASNTR